MVGSSEQVDAGPKVTGAPQSLFPPFVLSVLQPISILLLFLICQLFLSQPMLLEFPQMFIADLAAVAAVKGD